MKSYWCAAIIVATITLGSGAAIAQSWPSKPIRAFIPFAAGSATDIVPRAVFELLGAELGQSIIVENRGGAGGTLGMGAVVRADPDGYTILANSSAHTIAPWIVPNFPFDLTKDLSSVLMIGQNANILIPAQLAEFLRPETKRPKNAFKPETLSAESETQPQKLLTICFIPVVANTTQTERQPSSDPQAYCESRR
jgi:hypothetical protein